MPAEHQDVWYRPMSDIPLTEPRWVKMVEIRPTNLKARKIIHHSIAYLVLNNDPDAVNTGTANGPARGGFDDGDLVNRRPQLMEWAIGKGYDLYRPGTGKLLVPGEKISWDQHIHAVGEEVTGGSEIGIWFYKKGEEPKKRSYLIGFTGIDRTKMLDIPPNSMAMTEGFTVLKENALIENFQPHFHLRGKSMQVEAILPDGSTQIISYVGNFNFNWMTNYIYDDDAAPLLPKGTVIHVTAWYDNTKANKNNPDPDQWVGYGDRTVDEMAHAWMNVVYFNDAEYKALQAERKAKTGEDDATTTRSSSEPTRDSVRRRRRSPAAFFCRRRQRDSRAAPRRSAPASPARSRAGSTTRTAAAAFWSATTTATRSQELDIPIGPNNRIEPGGPDMGQPTHFLPGRQWGMFTVPVPKDSSRPISYAGRSSPTARRRAFRCACTPTT